MTRDFLLPQAASLGLIDKKDADPDSYVAQKSLDGLFCYARGAGGILRSNPLGAASKAKDAENKLALAALESGRKAGSPAPAKPPAPVPPPFDVGKFAAIGLAVGALGTALASVLTGLLALKWWQLPLALAGLLLIVSGPAVILAWFKLRSHNLGPILDANGWAINARACINIPFGTSPTQLAQLPAKAERALADPYAEKPTPWRLYLFVATAVFVVLWWFFR